MKRLKNHPYAQCHVETCDSAGYRETTFVSYETPVVKIIEWGPRQGGGISVRFLNRDRYSPTTARQVTWFLQEYLPDIPPEDIREARIYGTPLNYDYLHRRYNA